MLLIAAYVTLQVMLILAETLEEAAVSATQTIARRLRPMPNRQDVHAIADSLLAELAPPGSLTQRNFAQLRAAEALLARCAEYFARIAPTTPELAAVELIAPKYAARFPLDK